MEKILLVKYGEIMLKGLNRPYFESQLVKNIKRSLQKTGDFNLIKAHGRVYVEIINSSYSYEEVAEKIAQVFGVIAVAVAYKVKSDLKEIENLAVEVAKMAYQDGFRTFKVSTNRADKNFRPTSNEISIAVGGKIFHSFEDFLVDVRKPEVTIKIDIRLESYVYYQEYKGNGGMPVGSAGKGLLLLSGGIDSPVAGFMALKRGLKIETCYFHSHPYTTEQAKEKVIELARKLSMYNGGMRLHIVNFTDTQLEIYQKCPHAQLTIIMRRVMMKIAEQIAYIVNGQALITGESLGQVASQTIESLHVTNRAVDMLVLRPLIGMDKIDVIKIAESIDTYETSILPYEDCCTIFVAKHPETKPRLENILKSEESIDIDAMVKKCMSDYETVDI
ncbi:MAG: tRNA 4-thiouridine(8) synthase ThiI [Clostridia bacterium]|nr:tRNA 4-thiouridine(8) synthase ThiI [Clostridia bacterium]